MGPDPFFTSLSPTSNPQYQITNGDSIIVGTSLGYKINKTITIDGGYAHAFNKDEDININGNALIIDGVNGGERNAVILKLTCNL